MIVLTLEWQHLENLLLKKEKIKIFIKELKQHCKWSVTINKRNYSNSWRRN